MPNQQIILRIILFVIHIDLYGMVRYLAMVFQPAQMLWPSQSGTEHVGRITSGMRMKIEIITAALQCLFETPFNYDSYQV
uniref:Uncharacterized protein n=1 Tax=Arion vulgaris TaxID=1028688 RepID=A0A0B6ZJ31_9EUPU